jgi:hypothetical protein
VSSTVKAAHIYSPRYFPLPPPYAHTRLRPPSPPPVSQLDEEYDAHGRYERWPHGAGWGTRSDLNTGVVLFRATNGSKAFLQVASALGGLGAHSLFSLIFK